MNARQHPATYPSPAQRPRSCECFPPLPPAGWRITVIQKAHKLLKSTRIKVIQKARKLIKAIIWTPLTRTLDRVGLGLHTVQVLCIDRAADGGEGRVLILRCDEVAGGYSPVQGLRRSQRLLPPWSALDPDARADACAELREEATPEPPALERFRLVRRYREGTRRGHATGQFACSVFVIDCTMDEFPLHEENGEGTPCWARIEDAVTWLDNPILTPILKGGSVAVGDFERRRTAVGMGQGRVRT